MTQRAYRPYRLNVDGADYDIELGRPGKPRIYRVHATGSRVRVPDTDQKTLERIAHALRHDVDQRKAAEAREAAIRASWINRTLRRIARPLQRFYWWCNKVIAQIPRG